MRAAVVRPRELGESEPEPVLEPVLDLPLARPEPEELGSMEEFLPGRWIAEDSAEVRLDRQRAERTARKRVSA